MDREADKYKEYFASMPWAAVPFANQAQVQAAAAKFQVQGIPTLVVLRPDGSIVTKEAVQELSTDPTGSSFPWAPPTIRGVFKPGTELQLANGAFVDAHEHLSKFKYVGVYASASWCGPCRAFSPQLKAWYAAQNAASPNNVEIVFVSRDRSDADFDRYYGDMPWAAIPYDDSDDTPESILNREAVKLLKLQGIPTLHFFEWATDRVVSEDGRTGIMTDPEGFPWPPKPVEPFESAMAVINDVPAVLFFDATAPGIKGKLPEIVDDLGESTFISGGVRKAVMTVVPASHPAFPQLSASLHLSSEDKAVFLVNSGGVLKRYNGPANVSDIKAWLAPLLASA